MNELKHKCDTKKGHRNVEQKQRGLLWRSLIAWQAPTKQFFRCVVGRAGLADWVSGDCENKLDCVLFIRLQDLAFFTLGFNRCSWWWWWASEGCRYLCFPVRGWCSRGLCKGSTNKSRGRSS